MDYLNHCDALDLDGVHIPDCDYRYPHDAYTRGKPREEWKYESPPKEELLKIRGFCDKRRWEKVLSGWGGPYASRKTDDCLYLTKANLETASILGAKVLRIVPDGFPDYPRRYNIEWAVRNLKKATELARSYDITLGLENHPVIPYGSDIIEIINRVDSEYLRTTLDTHQLYSSSDPHLAPIKTVELLATHIVATHIRDIDYYPDDRTYCSVPCGEGIVDLPTIASTLKDAGYEGTLTLELGRDRLEGTTRDEAIKKSLEYLRKL
jgi:sugar phosphate isomerase/epimerase